MVNKIYIKIGYHFIYLNERECMSENEFFVRSLLLLLLVVIWIRNFIGCCACACGSTSPVNCAIPFLCATILLWTLKSSTLNEWIFIENSKNSNQHKIEIFLLYLCLSLSLWTLDCCWFIYTYNRISCVNKSSFTNREHCRPLFGLV